MLSCGLAAEVSAQTNSKFDSQFMSWPVYNGGDLELTVDNTGTHFRLWSPKTKEARVKLYDNGHTGEAYKTLPMKFDATTGTWSASVPEKLYGKFYTFQINSDGKWLKETPGVWAKAVGVNGDRAAIIDLDTTDPEGWAADKGPEVKSFNDVIVYEMHHRDMSMHPSSGIANKGKFLALTEEGTLSPQGLKTGIDHLKELGVTHVHILPSYDYNSVDELNLQNNIYNWGYDPLNYNAPEGSYSTNPSDPKARVREMKEMIKALHDAGIGVIMDVVYNHTAQNDDSNFELTAPGYYHRHWDDGRYSDASGCGNETASDLQQMRDYIINSTKYWADEYHIDGFRFDLMGLLTVELMNRIRYALDAVFGPGEKLLYGEPWRAADSPMEPGTAPAMKGNIQRLDPNVGIFCDTTRDAIKGDCFHAEQPGFVSGGSGLGETILCAVSGWMGCVGDFKPRACSQVVNYVSAHDNFTLWDKLAQCSSKAGPPSYWDSREDLLAQNKLAAFMYFTCQGNLFLQAGEEFARTKLGDHNSYKSSPDINKLDWHRAWTFGGLTDYYRQLIRLRKSLPGLCGKTPEAAKKIVEGNVYRDGVVSFQVEEGGSRGERLFVVYNATEHDYAIQLPSGRWTIRADGVNADQHKPLISEGNWLKVHPRSGMLLQK